MEEIMIDISEIVAKEKRKRVLVINGGLLMIWDSYNRNYPIRIHSANPVGVANMRRIIQRNSWKEVF